MTSILSKLGHVDEAHRRGLRNIAMFEAFKGALGLAAAITLIALAHRDFSDIAEHVVAALHMNPDSRLADMIFNAGDKATPSRIHMLALGAFAYTAIRFVEAYGLWRLREWAEWFAMLSGMFYIPFEVMALFHHPSWFKWVVLLSNLGMVGYLVSIRLPAWRRHKLL